jgi:hypothetical protein
MAEPSDSFSGETVAFVQMHGAVKPRELVSSMSDKTTPECRQYQVTGKPLPENTQLCAPKILGKSYHATNTSDFIGSLHASWNASARARSFSEFCLSKLNTFEQTQLASMKQEMESSDFIQIMEGGYTSKEIMERRLVLEGAIVAKRGIKWDKHECSIAEKSYHVIAKDSIQNCIMFFCNGIEPPHTLLTPIVSISNGSRISLRVRVSYNKWTKVFKITFDRKTNYEFSFEDLNNIIRSVVSGFTCDLDFNLTIFDFTCCVGVFPQNDDCLIGLTPQLLSSVALSKSDDGHPKLIYGTIREDRLHDLKPHVEQLSAHNRVDAVHNVYAGPASQDDFFTQQSLSQSDYQYHSPSPAQPPTLSILVNLMGDVASFADFDPISKGVGRGRSVSPPVSKTHGGGRAHIRKKAHRKQITRRRRHTNRRLRTKGSIHRTRK